MTWRTFVSLIIAVGYLCFTAAALRAAESADVEAKGKGLELVEHRKIWDQAPHNAFTDLVRHNDRWWCVFREGEKHVSNDGRLRVITSADGKEWESAALITSPDEDLRDAKLRITPNGEFMLSGAGALHKPDPHTHQSYAWFSDDGYNWSEAVPVADPGFWLWRVTWHKGMCYGVGYQAKGNVIRLYRSPDGREFETLAENMNAKDYPNETALVFLPDDTALCLLRRDPANGMLGRAKPPYTDWQWQDLGARIGGPNMICLPDGRLLAAVRLYDGSNRTALCWIDADRGTLTEALALPSGGDSSYAGLVSHEGQLWVSDYSSHEGRAAIYLAQVKVLPEDSARE